MRYKDDTYVTNLLKLKCIFYLALDIVANLFHQSTFPDMMGELETETAGP